MRQRILTALLAAAATITSLAQGGSSTPLGELADKLKLDPQKQLPAVQQMVVAASKDAAPIAQEMLELRQRIVNLELTNKTAEAAQALEKYADAATRMAGLETRVFQEVYATLTPVQKQKAGDAFAVMAGFFQSSGGRGGRRGGGGE
jgi:DNA-binding MarR family transcriptional regulator